MLSKLLRREFGASLPASSTIDLNDAEKKLQLDAYFSAFHGTFANDFNRELPTTINFSLHVDDVKFPTMNL